MQLILIPHKVGTDLIHQRAVDGYVNATAICKAVNKLFGDYFRLSTTQAFLAELSSDMGIPISGLIVSLRGGPPDAQGTWVHPDVAINLGQWCSPKFAVAVSRWVREWMAGKSKPSGMPYHIKRYIANRELIPKTHFSMLNEMIFALIAPLEGIGYTMPDRMIPDISMGLMFCKFLREVKHMDTAALQTYEHKYEDGRVVQAKLYPNEVLADVREYFHEVWMPTKAEEYFRKKDPAALEFLPKLLPPPDPKQQEEDIAKSKFHHMKELIYKKPDSRK